MSEKEGIKPGNQWDEEMIEEQEEGVEVKDDDLDNPRKSSVQEQTSEKSVSEISEAVRICAADDQSSGELEGAVSPQMKRVRYSKDSCVEPEKDKFPVEEYDKQEKEEKFMELNSPQKSMSNLKKVTIMKEVD